MLLFYKDDSLLYICIIKQKTFDFIYRNFGGQLYENIRQIDHYGGNFTLCSSEYKIIII